MSPILLRPIREQIEHDRVVRQLYARWRRRYVVAINPDREEEASVRVRGRILYPDVVLTNTEGVRRPHAVVEVETTESVNHLEAMSQWAPLAKARGAFYLYVPAGLSDVALRLCDSNGINVAEIWTYYAIGKQVRFSLSYRSKRAKQAAKNSKNLKKSRALKRAKTSKKAKKKIAKKKIAKKKIVKKKIVKKKIAKKTSSAKARKSKASSRAVKKKAKARGSVKSVRSRVKSKRKK